MTLSRSGSKITKGVMTMPRTSTTSLQLKSRESNHFPETEATLPKLPRRSSSGISLVDNVLSYLGPRNPFPHQIASSDTVWILDNTAYRSQTTGKWEAEFVAAVWETTTGTGVCEVVGDVVGKIGGNAGDDEIVEERLRPFVREVRPGRVVNVRFGEKQHGSNLKLGPGGRNGISSDIRPVPDGKGGEIVTSRARVPDGTQGLLEFRTVFAEPEGWGVISDIDDSIKVTQTSSPTGILRNTFLSEPEPIAGMPEFYAYLQTLITTSAPFFYLSASPYNLYSFLSDFRQTYFPQGTIILRDANWMNLSGLLETLTVGTEEYKVDRMEKIYKWLPKRKMICVGDSTQSDPEAYGDMYRKNPEWIKLILIRKVTDIAAIGIEEKNESARFEKAFKDVPKSVWKVFENPQECYTVVDNLVRERS